MALLVKGGREAPENWIKAIIEAFPDIECRVWPDVGDPAEIEFVLANELPDGAFGRFANLKFVAGTRVGVEGLLRDPSLAPHVPIVRNTDRQRAATMTGWVIHHVVRHHRRFAEYEANQRAHKWEQLRFAPPEKIGIGIMGMGTLGSAVGRALAGLMYRVAGWSRSRKTIAGIESFAGAGELPPFLARSNILISILPKTKATDDILDAERFAMLPKGAFFINCGRGSTVDEDALVAAIDSGHLAGAALDVFKTEPLPADHPFWDHPKIAMTPHYCCTGSAAYGAEAVIEAIGRTRAGKPIENTVDRRAGY